MNQRKQGRRTAEEAQKTKLSILTSAAYLFCERGYNQVSIRDISELAGVTHSLIRHYFGAKNQIWYAILVSVHEHMTRYMNRLAEHFEDEPESNVKLYLFLCHLMAFSLKKPQKIQIMLDFLHHPENKVPRPKEGGDGEQSNISSLVELMGSSKPAFLRCAELHDRTIMWRFMSHAGAAVSFKPFMESIWPELDHEARLVEHWKIYESEIARRYGISTELRLSCDNLDSLVIKFGLLDEESKAMFSKHFACCDE